MRKKAFFIILLVIIGILIIDLKVFAQNCSGSPDDGQGCSNGGDLRNGCNWICNNAPPDTVLNPIPCCETLAQTGDPFACCFDARRRCTPQQCSSISGAKQRCGQLWEGGYCNNSPNNIPSPTPTPISPKPTSIQSTATLKATTAPQPSPKPTSIVRVPPNESPPPIISNRFQNSRDTSVTQQFEFPSIQFPKITFPKININLAELNQNVRKPLGFFEYVFGRITYYDSVLESIINMKLRSLTK